MSAAVSHYFNVPKHITLEYVPNRKSIWNRFQRKLRTVYGTLFSVTSPI